MANPVNLHVSIVIPTYNRARMIKRAVESVISQCVAGDEIIVIDDGSTDDTKLELESFRGRIRYIWITNSGAGAARNRGIDEAKNDLIAFLDSDDEWMPGKLAIQRSLMQSRPDILFCFSNFAVKNKNGDEIRAYLANWHQDDRTWSEILGPGIAFSEIVASHQGINDFQVYTGNLYRSMMSRSYIFTGTLMVRRKEAGSSLRFATDMATFEDWVCFGRLAGAGIAAYLDCDTAWQYGHFQARLTDLNLMGETIARIQTLEKVWGVDSEFLAGYKPDYLSILTQHRIILITELLAAGQNKKARSELRKCESKPYVQLLLAYCPVMISRPSLSLARSIKKVFRSFEIWIRRKIPRV